MNILLASSEAVPFAKTGGLADVCGSLPLELTKLGHEVILFLPAYRCAKHAAVDPQPTGVRLDVPIGNKIVSGTLLKTTIPDTQITVYLVEHDDYYERDGLYDENGEAYKDNCERFVFFCRAIMESIRLAELDVDVIHANDWQTSLLSALLKIEYGNAVGYEDIVTVLTIHNMAYQGQFWHWDMLLTGIDWKYFNFHQMEYYGQLNLLKTGIVFSDSINTVSPKYAQEIQYAPMGCGLESVLHSRRDVLSGIINGVNYDSWNPAVDPFLPANYNAENWQDGKAVCKSDLQAELNLPQRNEVPLIGIVGRMADQKGFDLVAPVIEKWVSSSDAQWAILGTGDPRYHELFARLSAEFPLKVAARLEFSDEMAHRIEAGSDIFLMPSRYEPCGLNQLYSLKYGTVPVVHATGGLSDTIVDASPEHLANGTANGFSFHSYEAVALEECLRRACDTFRGNPTIWNQLVTSGMNQDWSWSHSARAYVDLYERTIARVKQTTVCA